MYKNKTDHLSSQFGKSNVMGFSNMNDMAKELNKMMSGGGVGMMGNTTSIKLDMIEYKKTRSFSRRQSVFGSYKS